LGWEIELLHYDEYIISGTTRSYGAGSDDVYLLRTASDPAGIRARRRSVGGALCLRAWPNPSASEVTIEYALPADSNVRITIHDCRGRRVRSLGGAAQACGPHRLEWDGKDAKGRGVGPGIYFYTVTAAGRTATIKSVLLR
jgi:hypothetical protein